jgi:hypothetical protein
MMEKVDRAMKEYVETGKISPELRRSGCQPSLIS